MTTVPAVPARSRSVLLSITSMAGGVSLAIIPAATVSISSRIFSIGDQGILAVAVLAATFISQLVAAFVVESRLSMSGTSRTVAFPRWLAALSFLAAIAMIIGFHAVLVVSIALPFLLASLEVGRSVSVAERLDRQEIWAAAFVGSGAVVGVSAAYLGQSWGFISVAFGITAATIVRTVSKRPPATHANWSVRAWVVTDVGVTGVVYPLLNSVILAVLGPALAVLFTAISTVSGLLAIPLNFMRLRLLKEHSRLDVAVTAAALVVCMGVLAILEFLGVFGFIFGDAWTVKATALALLVACLWRSASLASTIPFAALRRAGYVRVLTILRAAVALATFATAAWVVGVRDVVWVFVVMLVGELVQAGVYQLTRVVTNRRQ